MSGQDPFAAYINQTENCERCGVPCVVFGSGNPDARILKRSDEPKGVCVNCATVQALKDLLVLMSGGLPTEEAEMKFHLPGALKMQAVQEQFGLLLKSGNSDAALSEIDWNRVVENWSLP